MFETQIIHTEHKDVIHDVAYDYYGQRMATCSSDQYVKVWDQNEQGVWSVTSSWKSHSGSVWRLSWAHPEFGQVLATSSFDRTVSVWEETVGEKTNPAMPPLKRWVRRTNLVDSRTSVTDVKFAPKSQGLMLAACSADGVIRIYEAPDIMNLSQWTLSHEISVKIPLSCLTWNPSMFRLHPAMIAAGSDDSSQSTGGKVFIFEYSENARRWAKTETINSITEPVHDIAFAPNVGRSYHILAVASKDVQIFNLKPILDPTANSRLEIQPAAQFGDHYCTVWRVTWNITGTMLASTGDDGCVRMWKMNYLKNWRCAAVLKAENSESAPETSVTASLKSSIEYVLRVQRGPCPENSWRILRRYNDFASLNKCLQISGIDLSFPGKKLIGNMRPDFVAERLNALQEYINQVLMNPILASSLPTKKFIDPDSYSTPFHDLALQYASMSLRTEGVYTLGQSLGPIGWRLRKHYFKVVHKPQGNKHSPGHSTTKHHLIKSSSQSHGKQHTTQVCVTTSTEKDYNSSTRDHSGRDDLILSWTEFGPDRYIDEKDIHTVLKNFGGVAHPYIVPIEHIASNDTGALVIRKFYKQGSLKDVLCSASPCNPFLSKYGSPKGRTPLPLKDLALYARQILEAIRFLHSKGMACGHVHCGNVIVVDGIAKLMDVENFIFGVPSFYRPFFVQHSKINTCEAIDVYGFGHLLYEMCMGYPLQDSYARQISDCPDSLKSLLESILSKDACKSSLPTLDQLTTHPFFSEYAGHFNELYATTIAVQKPHLKFSTSAKEQLKLAVQKTENRVRDEQRSVKNQKRLVRVQEMMTSEEEKKKIKQKAKHEQKQAKLRAQNSLQLNNGPPMTGPSGMAATVHLSSSTGGIVKSDSANSITSPQEALMSPPPHATDSGGSTSPQPPPSAPPIPGPPSSLPLFPVPADSGASGGASASGKLAKSISGDESTTGNRSALLQSICNFNKSGLKKISPTDEGGK
uniref:PX domain-containing protein kinase-like protein n=2 Tax=Anopheles stephensi TaxID=30069 RepID=A0A182YIG3_ANOST